MPELIEIVLKVVGGDDKVEHCLSFYMDTDISST